MVRPVSATRMRAPGGSFIWPNTSMVFSITPDSVISSHRSLPSRERSPTPQNADRPPCSWARLLMSSWMRTVLPTPAPPNRPILPPLAYGASRSTTLMPVSNISVVGVRFSTFGASRWIGQRSTSSAICSPWSIVSPSRLKIRPRVGSPTGTVIGPPVSTTSVPRASPSVVSIATARTRSSPRWCWLPCLASRSPLLDQGLCAGHDFHDLLRDLGLACAVHLEREVVDDLAGVLGGVAHGGHARAVLGRGRLEQRAVDRDLD